MQLNVRYLPHYNRDWGDLCYAKAGDSAFDLRAAMNKSITVLPGQKELIPTGVQVEMVAPSSDYEIQIRPRSGLAAKKGISLVNTPGTIDWGYRGELIVILINLGTEPFDIQPGDRIAQAAICPIVRATFVEVDGLSDSDRGTGRFGSTGV